jgi:hypothetical protein
VTVSSPSRRRYSADPDLIRREAQRALSADCVTITARVASGAIPNPGATCPSGEPPALFQAPFGREAARRARVVMRESCYI